MKVLKFGGTSVGTVESLANVKSIVESIDDRVIVVVSALGGLTDKLIATARMASVGDEGYRAEYDAIIRRHHDIIERSVSAEYHAELRGVVDPLLKELGDVYLGISLLQDLSARTLDRVVSFGERLSSVIISYIIDDAELFYAPDFIKTVNHHGRHVLDDDASLPLISAAFSSRPFRRAIVPGFISRDCEGRYTNLGRGGSDYTAAILAAALDAQVLEIWTDVDGFMTADPRILSDAHVIDSLSFIEAMELCNFGAKVIYPPTIYPVFHKSIPIYIKNTFHPWAPGTRISDDTAPRQHSRVSGVTSMKNICIVAITAGDDMNDMVGLRNRLINVLSRSGVTIYNLVQTSGGHRLTFAVPADSVERAAETIENEYAPELQTGELRGIAVERDMSIIALVGDNLQASDGDMADRVRAILVDGGVTVRAMLEGSSATTVSVVVGRDQEHAALRLLHDNFLKF